VIKLGTLAYSVEDGEGVVKIGKNALPRTVIGLDILQDWIGDLETTYREFHAEVFPRGTDALPRDE
jgi:hypothetical protein